MGEEGEARCSSSRLSFLSFLISFLSFLRAVLRAALQDLEQVVT